MFEKKTILFGFIISIFITSHLYANCGKCGADISPDPKKSSSLVIEVPEDGMVEGLVIASCGMCNFGTDSRGCNLNIKIGDLIYSVERSSIHDHGDAHSKEGMCNVLRIAYTRGKIKKDKFYPREFVLLESPE